MISWLDALEKDQVKPPPPARTARVQVVTQYKQKSNQLIELIINLQHGDIVKQQHLVGKHPYVDSDYMKQVEKACLADSKVKMELKTLQIPTGASIVAEPWTYATDGLNDMSERFTMVCSEFVFRFPDF